MSSFKHFNTHSSSLGMWNPQCRIQKMNKIAKLACFLTVVHKTILCISYRFSIMQQSLQLYHDEAPAKLKKEHSPARPPNHPPALRQLLPLPFAHQEWRVCWRKSPLVSAAQRNRIVRPWTSFHPKFITQEIRTRSRNRAPRRTSTDGYSLSVGPSSSNVAPCQLKI
jgi:hypothetical protein